MTNRSKDSYLSSGKQKLLSMNWRHGPSQAPLSIALITKPQLLDNKNKMKHYYNAILGLYDRDQPTNEGHSLIGYKEKCHSYNFLVEKQKELCSLDEDIIEVLRSGMRMAIQECQYQFSMIRWNCSTFDDSPSIFGAVSKIKSRETAFLYSISSAGVTYSVTRACSSGKLTECSCDPRVRLRKPRKHWQWGGCSEDIHYGEKFSREFIDCYEDPNTAEGLMNLHNNEAGRRVSRSFESDNAYAVCHVKRYVTGQPWYDRSHLLLTVSPRQEGMDFGVAGCQNSPSNCSAKVIRSRMQKVCKCHGMSGSCSVRACWRKLPPFRKIGDVLTSRFEGASSVRLIEKKKRKIKKLRASKKELKQPNKTEMVYLEESPDYCERNDSLGILGTHGRVCRRDSLGLDGCKLLCCGRGYQTRLREVEQQCNCHFVWCCNVICEICTFKKEEHICN
ncbi:unnamed protein product [Nezara viridula]|uniref:Protein Wnt n=1 Tax=Nezara viridula TaxID=85310 RepID=A0A9P0E480_NEZVI|nr:unnamed protein product [Nezara viridula]